MKHVVTVIGLLCAPAVVLAQGYPGTLAFTARVSDGGNPITGPRDFTFKLFDAPSGGAMVWQESQLGVQVQQGLAYVDLGVVNALDAAIFDGSALFLDVTVGGQQLSPRLPIQSVPYAFRAQIADSADTLGPLSASDVVTTVTGTGAVQATRMGNTVTLDVNTGMLQQRIAGTCPPGSAIRTINSDGTVGCETYAMGTITSVSGTNGLAGGGTTGAVSMSLVPCANGEVLRSVGGAWTCSALPTSSNGDITGVTAGSGLTGGGTVGDVTLAVSFAGTGSATTAARSDHTHSTYLPKGATLACTAAQKVVGLDMTTGNVQCATDATGTAYTAGLGISIGSNTISANLAPLGGEEGTSTLIARADHKHDTAYINNNTSTTAETGSIFINGAIRTTGMVRLGSEANAVGLSEPYLIVRRVESTSTASGVVVAEVPEMQLVRDGTTSGLRVLSPMAIMGRHTVVCSGVTAAGTTVGKVLDFSSGVVNAEVFSNTQDVLSVHCMFGRPFVASHVTTVDLLRAPGDNYWIGTLTSTHNQ